MGLMIRSVMVLGLMWVGFSTGSAQSTVRSEMPSAGTIIVGCNVYPLTIHESSLDAKIPLAAEYWNTDPAELLQPHYAASVFTVPISPALGILGLASWIGDGSSNDELAHAMTFPGTLAFGFEEVTPPVSDTVALAQMNQRLEVGDWMFYGAEGSSRIP